MDRAMDRKRDEERLTKAEWEKQQREDLLADKKETYKDYPKEDIEDHTHDKTRDDLLEKGIA